MYAVTQRDYGGAFFPVGPHSLPQGHQISRITTRKVRCRTNHHLAQGTRACTRCGVAQAL